MRKREIKVDQKVTDKVFKNWGVGTIREILPDCVAIDFRSHKKKDKRPACPVGRRFLNPCKREAAQGFIKFDSVLYFESDHKYLKRYPPLRHKGVRDQIGCVYDYCSMRITESEFSFKWDKVTCKNCLRKGKNFLRRK